MAGDVQKPEARQTPQPAEGPAPGPADLPKFTFVIPARNEAAFIDACIRSVLDNAYPDEKKEVIVVDGGSTDGTRARVEQIAEADGRVHVHENPKRIAPAGMNVGIRHATGEVVVILSGHARVSSNYMAECARILREHPDVWRAGGVTETVGRTCMGRVVAAAQTSPVGVGAGNWRLGIREGYIPLVAFGAVRRWVFDRIGLYDEELVRNQDDEFSQRMTEAGGPNYMTRSVRVRYFCRGSLWQLARQYYQYGFWRYRTIQKRGKPAHLRQVLPILFVLGWLPLAALAAAGAVWWWPLAIPLAAYAAVYVLGLVGNIFWVGRRDGWGVALLTPPACAAIHFGYGWGGLVGFVHWGILRGRFVPKPEAHGLTR